MIASLSMFGSSKSATMSWTCVLAAGRERCISSAQKAKQSEKRTVLLNVRLLLSGARAATVATRGLDGVRHGEEEVGGPADVGCEDAGSCTPCDSSLTR